MNDIFVASTSNTKTDEETSENDLCKQLKSLEERRKSLLDHHWAVPSKDRYVIVLFYHIVKFMVKFLLITTHCEHYLYYSKSIDDESIEEAVPSAGVPPAIPQVIAGVADNQLTKGNCHDSGIDIRDPNAIVPPITAKKNYSDADIVLSSDWVPPITIAPTDITDSPAQMQTSTLGTPEVVGGRKKTSSVSFSVEDNSEHHSSTSSDRSNEGNKKNKMLKRLSYPLTWVEGLTGEGKPVTDSTESAPNTGDSNQSVFSKVFSR